MGTCIGVGMDRGLKQSGMVFDTVIIDEAGKANLAETAVPMQLGKKYILVGDQRQLPPYVDKDEISSFIKETSIQGLTQESVVSAISYSLFEDFLEDDRFPSESTIQLNYQYRMNPEIASYVSDLFYDKTLKNGHGTEKQTCPLDEFSDAVTFIDTSVYNRVGEKNIAYEEKDSSEGYYNPYEIEIFRNRILPNLIRLKKSNEVISVGIITPYRSQRQYLLKELLHTPLEGSVYTIDSIQGTEFDIVVISLVRAFSSQSKKNCRLS
jgi:superfamily I DNA and/or RNA helicase